MKNKLKPQKEQYSQNISNAVYLKDIMAEMNNWSTPIRVSIIEKENSIEFIYKQTSLIKKGYSDLEQKVFKIIYSCVDGKWNKSEPIYGVVIPASDESYMF